MNTPIAYCPECGIIFPSALPQTGDIVYLTNTRTKCNNCNNFIMLPDGRYEFQNQQLCFNGVPVDSEQHINFLIKVSKIFDSKMSNGFDANSKMISLWRKLILLIKS